MLAVLLVAGTACAQNAREAFEANPLRAPEKDARPPAAAEQPDATAAEDRGASTETEQTNQQPVGLTLSTKEQIEELVARVDTLNLTADEKINAKKLYQDALQMTVELAQQQAITADRSNSYKQVPDPDDPGGPDKFTKEWYQKRLALPIDEVIKLKEVNLKRDATELLEELATKREAYAEKWSKQAKELEAAPNMRKQFLSDLPTKKQAIELQLKETNDELAKIAAGGITNEVTAARRTFFVQRVGELNAELAALKAQREEIQRKDAVYDLEFELAKRKAARYQETLAAIRDELSNRRKEAASEQAQLAQREADRNKKLIGRNANSLGTIANYNVALTEELQDLVSAIDSAQAEHDADTATNDTMEATLEKFESQFGDNDNLTQVSGQLLRDQRAKLPRLSRLKSKLVRFQNDRNDINFRRFEANQRLEELKEIDTEVARVMTGVVPNDRREGERVARRLLASQVEYLTSYVAELDKLDAKLGELIGEKTQLVKNTADFREFIAERDLWIRSCRPLWASQIQPGRGAASWRPFYLKPAVGATAWSLNPSHWLQVALDLQRSATRQPLVLAGVIGAFGLLFVAQQRARALIRELGKQAAQKTCTDFYPSLRTVWLTAIVSLPWPLLLWGIGWTLDGPWVESEFTRAFSLAIRSTAWIFLLAEFMRQCCRADGLAEAHLGWPRAVLLQMRRYLRWIPILIVPLVVWIIGLDMQNTQPLWSASLGRVLFIVAMGLLTVMLWRLFMSGGSAFRHSLDQNPDNWLLRTHPVWRPLLVLRPVVLAIMAVVGYYYTAEQLTLRVLATEAMLMGLIIAGGLLRRWVLLNRRELAREQARQRRAQAVAAAEAAKLAAADGDVQPAAPAEMADIATDESVDLTALSEQTRKLLRIVLVVCGVFGAIFIWQDVFPALAWLDENPLPGLSGTSDDPTTWGHLMRSLLAVLLTYFAVRDLPSLLELVVLQHLPLDAGVRYAVSTLARYALLTIGIVVAAASLGITGTSISWLVAAMGVGLGFGLQEIFANFVSGIILLFERPIRVGDIVTLGDKTGIVNRIRMRATTIVDWDRKEYVVPNKDLVTERLLNWTLSDQTNRIVVEVGVAYGSDTDRACALLRETAAEHPIVLDDPAALITFESFGDSTLNLTLRCYLPNLENRLQTIHELHTAINNKFNAAGIEIAFPQRDLHIRSVPATTSLAGSLPTEEFGLPNGNSQGSRASDAESSNA